MRRREIGSERDTRVRARHTRGAAPAAAPAHSASPRGRGSPPPSAALPPTQRSFKKMLLVS
eukprot:6407498-Prymnesium_polylepis.1